MQSVAKAAARDKHKSLKVIIEDEMSLGSLPMNNFMNDYFNLILMYQIKINPAHFTITFLSSK
jgi:hypothetical protein